MEDFQPIAAGLPPLQTILSLAYYCMLGFFAVFTAVIYYHWTTYATDKLVSRVTLVSYMACTLPLLLIMGFILLNIN